MQVVIMLNMILMIVETQLEKHGIIYTTAMIGTGKSVADDQQKFHEYNEMCSEVFCGKDVLEFLSLAFVVVYIFEVVFKSVSLGWKVYFTFFHNS